MSDSQHSHRGRSAPSPFRQPVDYRITDLDDALRAIESASNVTPLAGFVRDSPRLAGVRRSGLNTPSNICRGTIIHSLPHLNWYKVQMAEIAGALPCCHLAAGGLVPVGPRDVDLLPPNSHVLVYKPIGLNHGFILNVIPPALAQGSLSCPDWLVQGGGGGLKREEAHKFPIKGTRRQGGTLNWSGGRPLDETAFQRGWVTPTGLALTLSDYMIQIRVNEMCGAWFNINDGYSRIAGEQLDVESLIHGEYSREDEGEARLMRGVAAYPWEAVGLYDRASRFTEEQDPVDVQMKGHVGAVDVPADAPEVQPIYRYVEHNGYSGPMRAIVLPARATGVRHYGEREVDEGLFRESIGLNGAYQLISAKSIHIGKRVRVIVPREIQAPEDGRGDDAAANNYRFSGIFGTAAEHRAADLSTTAAFPQMRKATSVHDVIAYDLNWKALHTFHYHQGDYFLPQANEGGPFNRGMAEMDFGLLSNGYPFVLDPTPVVLNIDHRYGSVSFFERESFLHFEDDGSVILGGGCGETLTFAGGDIELSTPGKVKLLSGTDMVVMAGQLCVRSRRSMDFDSATADVRFKADRNMQFLSGNSGTGGMLFENKAEGCVQVYANRFGEDVISSGITFLAKDSCLSFLANDLYVRSLAGDITLDAARGQADVNVVTNSLRHYISDQVTYDFGPQGENAVVASTLLLSAESVVIGGELLVRDRIVGYGDESSLSLRGDILTSGSVSASGSVSDSTGSYLGKVDSDFASSLEGNIAEAVESHATLNDEGSARYRDDFVVGIYGEGAIGDEALLAAIGFSYRDPPNGDQYAVSQFVWPEARWQQLARQGVATGGQPWEEPPVLYQGVQLYPYPGRRCWLDDPTFLQADAKFFDPATGHATDRPYDDATLPDWTRVAMATGFSTIR